jgi:nitrate/TMAO reductase-like tetraheme cytochrome c subunit
LALFGEKQETASSAEREDVAGSHPRTLRSRILVVAAVVLGVIAVVLVIDWGTSSPSLCGSCHEMAVRIAEWKESGHAEVRCVSCHAPRLTWRDYPQSLVARTQILGRDVYRHVTKQYKDPVDMRSSGERPMPDAVCLQCHSPNRKATSGFRIKIDHVEHAKRNGSCVSCHLRTAHPLPSRSRPMSLMSQCFTCHGTPTQPKASAECSVCHPSGYKLLPESHQPATWKRTGHGRVAKVDPAQCKMCHEATFCTNCHGLKMPHPAGWARGRTGHAALAQKDRAVCAKCHEAKPDLCSMCHHQSYDPTKGTWVKQHYLEVEKKGAAFCMECHGPVFCVQCHPSSQE